jgi:hypothetical protein
MKPTTRLWWRRRNPMLRRSDVVEGWAGLISVLLICVVAPLMGLAAADGARSALQSTVRAQEAALSQTTAVVVRTGLHGNPNGDPPSSQALEQRLGVVARWTAPDGSTHTGSVPLAKNLGVGSQVRIWIDRHGNRTGPPMDAAIADKQAVIDGVTVTLGAAAAVATARLAVIRQLTRRNDWEREWAQVAHVWGRTGTGG